MFEFDQTNYDWTFVTYEFDCRCVVVQTTLLDRVCQIKAFDYRVRKKNLVFFQRFSFYFST